jgi:hypothetical protein
VRGSSPTYFRIGRIEQPIGSKEQGAQHTIYYQNVTSAPLQGAAQGDPMPADRNGLRLFLLSVRSAASVTLEGSVNAMSTKYEDNFGFYCIDDDNLEELEFFCYIRAQSEPTICARCNRKMRLLEHIKICATCSRAVEYGEPSDPAWVVPKL